MSVHLLALIQPSDNHPASQPANQSDSQSAIQPGSQSSTFPFNHSDLDLHHFSYKCKFNYFNVSKKKKKLVHGEGGF